MFSLTDNQHKKLKAWDKKQAKKYKDISLAAIWGDFTYHFTPTGIGMVVKVTNNKTQETVDLTEYENW